MDFFNLILLIFLLDFTQVIAHVELNIKAIASHPRQTEKQLCRAPSWNILLNKPGQALKFIKTQTCDKNDVSRKGYGLPKSQGCLFN